MLAAIKHKDWYLKSYRLVGVFELQVTWTRNIHEVQIFANQELTARDVASLVDGEVVYLDIKETKECR